MTSKFRKALGAVKDQTSIGLAKVGNSNSLADLDVAIVKATRHEEYPAEEKYIREILSLTCYSRSHISSCVNTLARRLNKTKNWVVALKTLMLIHRLLSEGDPAYEQEIFFSTRRGTRFLNMSDFRDTSRSDSWDYSAFIRTYALYLDERLEYKMQSRRGKRSAFAYEEDDEEVASQICVRATPLCDMNSEQLFSRIQHFQQLLERFLACRPTGAAKHNRLVTVTLYPVMKESFQIYYDITEAMSTLIDQFPEMDVHDCVRVYEIFCRVGKQFDELETFYCWGKTIGITRSSEYPEVERITPKKLELMDEYIRDKSSIVQGNVQEEKNEPIEEEEPIEEDMNAIKALPPPEDFKEVPKVQEQNVIQQEPKKQDVGDLLNLGEDAPSSEAQENNLALALFDGKSAPTGPPPPPAWEAFNDTADWETTLVQSASGLSNQKTTLGGGFDMLLLDGMYQRATIAAAIGGPRYGNNGSASSVALGSAGRPAMLALPALPTSNMQGNNDVNVDPFAASMVVAPPQYVQMSDLEKKQKLLMDEKFMWQQYAMDGMPGQLGLQKLQQQQQQLHKNNSYYTGGHMY